MVFGQRSNTFHNNSMDVPSVNLSGPQDFFESQLEEEEAEEEKTLTSLFPEEKERSNQNLCHLRLTETAKHYLIFLAMTL